MADDGIAKRRACGARERDAAEIRRVYWRSRRGMLELDLLLLPFAREAYAGLAPELRAAYRELLSCEDRELWAWLLRRESAPARQAILDCILAHNAARSGKAD